MATITELVKNLVDAGLVIELGRAGGGKDRGRKRTQLKLNKNYGFAVGVEFDSDHITAAALDAEANQVAQIHSAKPFAKSRDAGIEQIKNVIAKVIDKTNISPEKLMGIGIADPGLVDSVNGISLLSTTLEDWHDVPIGQILQQHFGVPIHLEENTRSKLLAEKAYGAGRNAEHLMFVDFGAGVGISVISPNGFYRGSTESAGELGHTCVSENGSICRCGSYGCLETVASMPAIAKTAKAAIDNGVESLILELARRNSEQITADHVFTAASQSDKLALGIVEEAGRYFGIALANAVNLFNPEIIIFNQRFAEIGRLLIDPIKRTIARQALRLATKDLRFELGQLGNLAGAIGAAAMVLNDLFKIPQLEIPPFLAAVHARGGQCKER